MTDIVSMSLLNPSESLPGVQDYIGLPLTEATIEHARSACEQLRRAADRAGDYDTEYFDGGGLKINYRGHSLECLNRAHEIQKLIWDNVERNSLYYLHGRRR